MHSTSLNFEWSDQANCNEIIVIALRCNIFCLVCLGVIFLMLLIFMRSEMQENMQDLFYLAALRLNANRVTACACNRVGIKETTDCSMPVLVTTT